MSEGDFLSRWSRRKTASRTGSALPAAETAPEPPSLRSSDTPAHPAPRQPEPQPLPPVESLTPESDFTPFMKGEVDPGLRRQALKTLFQDPRFNVMDGLDVYIDDYTKADPLPEGWLEKMNMAARLGDYPAREEAARAAEEAAQKALETPAQKALEPPAPISGTPRIPDQEQVLEEAPGPSSADTSNAVSPPPRMAESGPH